MISELFAFSHEIVVPWLPVGGRPLVIPVVVVWIGIALLIFFLYATQKLYWSSFRFQRNLKALIQALEVEGKRGGDFTRASLNRVGAVLSKSSLCAHGWSEFTETVVSEQKSDQEQIYNTRQAGDFFSEDQLVADSMHPSFFRAVPGVLTSLGLLGTFLAILIGLGAINVSETQLPGAQAGEATRSSIEGIGPFVNALSGKFASSVLALILAIVFTLMETRVLAKAHGSYRRFCQSFDAVFPRRTSEEILMSMLTELNGQRSAFEHFNTDLSSKFRDGVSEGLGPVLGRLSESLAALKDERDQGIEALLERLTTEFRSAMSQSAGVEFGQVAEAVERAARLLQESNEHTQATRTTFDEFIQSTQESTATQQRMTAQQAESVEALLARMIGAMQEATTGVVAETGSWTSKVTDQLEKALADQQAGLEAVEKIRASLESTLATWMEGTKELRGVVAPLVGSADLLGSVSSDLKAVASSTERTQAGASEVLTAAHAEHETIRGMSEENRKLLAEYERVFAEVEKGLGATLDIIAKKLEVLQEVSARGLTEQLKEFDNHLGMATQKLGASVDELSQALDDAAETIAGASRGG